MPTGLNYKFVVAIISAVFFAGFSYADDAAKAPMTHLAGAERGAGALIEGPGGKRIKFSYPDPGADLHPPVKTVALTEPKPLSRPSTEAPTRVFANPAKPDLALLEATADEVGLASWYGEAYHGAPTANGEVFDMNALTAAHPTLPLPSLVQVTNLETGREVVVRVNDRGPVMDGRILDLSRAAADAIGFGNRQHARVAVRYLGAPVKQPIDAAYSAPAPISHKNDYSDVRTASVEEAAVVTIRSSIPEPRLPVPDPVSAVAPKTPAADGDLYFIQVGSFTDIQRAHNLQSQLKGRHTTDLESARVNGADYFRVMVGPFADRTQADQHKSAAVIADVQNGFVVKR